MMMMMMMMMVLQCCEDVTQDLLTSELTDDVVRWRHN